MPVAQFRPSRSQRRVWRRNADVRVEIGPPRADEQRHALYERYQAAKHDRAMSGSREDYEWSRERVRNFSLPARCACVLFSPVFGKIEPVRIVEWIIEDKLEVRFQLQMHKFIWDPKTKGV